MFRQATPGRHEIPLQVAEGDLVVSLIVGFGRHEGELLGIPATGNEVETEGIAIHRIRDGNRRVLGSDGRRPRAAAGRRATRAAGLERELDD